MQLLKKSIIISFQAFLLLWGIIYALITLLIPLNFLTISGWIIVFLPSSSNFQEKRVTLFGRQIKIKTIERIILIIICTITNLLYWNITKQIFYNFGNPR